jgi:hypothetical protein
VPSVGLGKNGVQGAGRAETTASTAEPRLRGPWPVRYARQLWNGDLPLSRVFWTDMLVVGTLVDVATLVGTMLLFAGDAPLAYGLIMFLIHIPYSVLLFIGVWRSAARERSRWSLPAQILAGIWLLAVLIL